MATSFDCVSSLLCGEDASEVAWDDEVGSSRFEDENVERLQQPDLAFLPDFPVEDDETIAFLVQKEWDHLPREDYLERYRNRVLDVTARQDAISWIRKVQSHYKFRPLTAYLSVNYLDRFLSSHELPQGVGWPLQLLSVACLSLAAKMEETEVPLLLDLQVK
jgi:cyclin D1/2/4